MSISLKIFEHFKEIHKILLKIHDPVRKVAKKTV